jgi:hypothetical protein
MEIKYSPVTLEDRIAILSNQNHLVSENKSNVHWGKILTVSVIGIIAIIYLSEYFNRKNKEIEGE